MYLISVIVTLAVVSGAVSGQRTSPQFSFPSPNQQGSNFPDTFSSQDVGLSGPQSQSSFASSSVGLGLSSASQQSSQSDVSSPSQSTSIIGLPQPTIQLSRPSLSLASLGQPSVSSSSSSSSSTSSSSSISSPSSRSSQSQSSQSLPSFASQAAQSQLHQSSRQPHSTSSSSSSSQTTHGSSSQHRQVAATPAHNQHPATLQAQVTGQSVNSHPSQQSLIEAARKAEATAASLAAVSGQAYQCPESFGFFRHHKSCDKYYACENGTATLKLCGNGLNFDDSDIKRENCAYPFSVDCGDRADTEPPISTPHCPRLYGLFPENNNCRVFYSCWNGEASKYECPPGLAYDNEQRVCVWADLVDRCDQSEVSDGFVCPDPSEVDQPGHYTRHAHPTDCRKFYVCIEGVARPYGCSFGSVFNVDSLQCDEPENVSGCEKYYGDIDPKTAKKLARENSNLAGPQGSVDRQPSSSSRTPAQAAH